MNKSNGIVQAKEEYTKELINILTEPMVYKFLTMYQNVSQNINNKRELIISYQKALREIPLWNQALIDTEVTKIKSNCEFLDDLVAAIFVTNVKILSSVKMNKDKQKIQVAMPKTDQFIHKIYTNAAHTLYNNPYIFSNQYDSQKRKAEIIVFVQNSIENTIRTNLPFRNILQNYLGSTVEESESEEESEDEKSSSKEIDDDEQESLHEEESLQHEDSEQPEQAEAFENPTPIQTQNEGFFDRPITQQLPPVEEEKTVPIQNPPVSLQMQEPQSTPPPPQQPMLFPDASGP